MCQVIKHVTLMVWLVLVVVQLALSDDRLQISIMILICMIGCVLPDA